MSPSPWASLSPGRVLRTGMDGHKPFPAGPGGPRPDGALRRPRWLRTTCQRIEHLRLTLPLPQWLFHLLAKLFYLCAEAPDIAKMSPAELGTYLGEELGFNVHQVYALVGNFVLQLRLKVAVDGDVRARLHGLGIELHDAMAEAAAARDGLQLGGEHLGAVWGAAHSAGCSPLDAGGWVDRGRAGAIAQPRDAKRRGALTLNAQLAAERGEVFVPADNYEFTLEDLQPYFKMTQGEAAAELNVSTKTLQRYCRKFGIPSWSTAT